MKKKWLKHLNDSPIEWLLESNPWTRYRTLVDLLDYPEDDKDVKNCRKEILLSDDIKTLIADTTDWMPMAASRNNDSQLSYFKLRMLSDFGIKAHDKGISDIKVKATSHVENELFACRGRIPAKPKKGEKFKKPDPDEDVWHISPCNSPMISYSLLSLGFRDEKILKSTEKMKNLWKDEIGWFCNFFFVNGQFKREQAGCPMAGLMALEIFSLFPQYKESECAKNAFAPLVYHKELGKSIYYFGRSKKFWTFKYPFVWYNALYMADVISRFDFARSSSILNECIDWIISNQDEKGRYKATSVFLPYKHFDFGQKREVSPWITFLCCRVLKRVFGE